MLLYSDILKNEKYAIRKFGIKFSLTRVKPHQPCSSQMIISLFQISFSLDVNGNQKQQSLCSLVETDHRAPYYTRISKIPAYLNVLNDQSSVHSQLIIP